MLRIKMLKDDLGSNNGFDVMEFKKGQEYEVSYALYDAFVKQRNTAIDAPIIEEKMLNPVVENKAIVLEVDNKSSKKSKK